MATASRFGVPALSTLRARPRLLLSTLLGILIAVVLPASLTAQTRGIVGWDIGVAVFLIATVVMMLRADIEPITVPCTSMASR